MIQIKDGLYINKEQIVYIRMLDFIGCFVRMSNGEEFIINLDSDYYKNISELLGDDK